MNVLKNIMMMDKMINVNNAYLLAKLVLILVNALNVKLQLLRELQNYVYAQNNILMMEPMIIANSVYPIARFVTILILVMNVF